MRSVSPTNTAICKIAGGQRKGAIATDLTDGPPIGLFLPVRSIRSIRGYDPAPAGCEKSPLGPLGHDREAQTIVAVLVTNGIGIFHPDPITICPVRDIGQ